MVIPESRSQTPCCIWIRTPSPEVNLNDCQAQIEGPFTWASRSWGISNFNERPYLHMRLYMITELLSRIERWQHSHPLMLYPYSLNILALRFNCLLNLFIMSYMAHLCSSLSYAKSIYLLNVNLWNIITLATLLWHIFKQETWPLLATVRHRPNSYRSTHISAGGAIHRVLLRTPGQRCMWISWVYLWWLQRRTW